MKEKLLGRIIVFTIKLLGLTWRYRWQNPEDKGKLKQLHMLAVWHRNIPGTLLSLYKHQSYVSLTSLSKDGAIAESIGHGFGFKIIRGSSSRGGKEAKAALLNEVQKGTPGVITVDGPRGPIYQVKFGIIEIAQKLNIPIIPACAEPEQAIIFRSWDRLRLPKPFSKIFIRIGEPIFIDSNLPPERYADVAEKVRGALLQIEGKMAEI